ncbi:16S rRNA (cytosine967-C5)-methyltransferase [Epibacterium ulvae]|uniref:16S rRNA (Cytosine967-C5)-methyltransferase n=2 Tax=Epibacterium ulvae TaxID=1156985 RepID=A0A1G5QAZ7_9RHOB|nr:16S rRNA (cytosine967-C5)-methyltransferase [Epibacterium ulvae]
MGGLVYISFAEWNKHMTPAARLQAAIEILDRVIAGAAAEQALTSWARASRFAGSKDRAAVRDHVFTALRCWRSHAALGGAETGRGLMLGAVREAGADPALMFTGDGYGPSRLTGDESVARTPRMTAAEENDLPDWIWPMFSDSLGADATAAAQALRHRAPVHLRVNLRASDVADAQSQLAEEGIVTERLSIAPAALNVSEGARKIRNSKAYTSGVVELQDAASQAVVEALPLRAGLRVLDYCAGGGGKSLAIAAHADCQVYAHDIDWNRMKDLSPRAERAGVQIELLRTAELSAQAPFDIVFCDAPCSGSGSWRRAPEGKWRLTAERLAAVVETQAEVLQQTAQLVAVDGVLAYATCSMLDVENENQVTRFLQSNPEWQKTLSKRWLVQDGADGFFVALLKRHS